MSSGLASFVMHKNRASKMLKLRNTEDDDEVDLKEVTDRIKKEIKDVPTMKNDYLILTEEELLQLHTPALTYCCQ